MADEASFEKLRRERDLYLRLLQLGRQTDLSRFLAEALALVVEVSETKQGYLELHDDHAPGETPSLYIAHGFSEQEIAGVREGISKGIVAEAMASGQTVNTPSARLDPRFQDLNSVRVGRIEAVLCVPIGQDPPRGVLYLQGRPAPGLFSDEECARAQTFAEHLAPLVDRLLERRHVARENDPTLPLRQKLRVEGVIGRSAALAAALKQVAMVAPLDIGVLLTGDSGTGKSQLARVIHDNGPRATQPFVELNCAALPETLVESELFGALPGAHSTATRRMEGKVAAAEHGTLFLDEIGDLPSTVQAKLLQLLQSKEYYPLGATKAVHADVRLIAATNVDLQQAVVERRFREDLYYRLNVLPLRVPSLSERREDIAEVARYVCAQTSSQYGLPSVQLSPGAVRALESAPWPGNVRQLAHAVEAAVIRCASDAGTQVEPSHLFPEAAGEAATDEAVRTFQEATRDFQGRLLRESLEQNKWNVLETARQLDLARSHVYTLIRAFGLEREDK